EQVNGGRHGRLLEGGGTRRGTRTSGRMRGCVASPPRWASSRSRTSPSRPAFSWRAVRAPGRRGRGGGAPGRPARGGGGAGGPRAGTGGSAASGTGGGSGGLPTPTAICGTSMLDGPTSPPAGAVVVSPGPSTIQDAVAQHPNGGTTYYLEAGTYLVNS